MKVNGKLGAKHLAIFEARKSMVGLPSRVAPDDQDKKLRPKSSYAGSMAASGVKSRLSTQAGSQVSRAKMFNKLKAKQLNQQIEK